MADASPGTRRGGLRRSSQSRSHNPPALRPRESRSPDRVASRGQRGECRCSGPSAGGGRDGGGQDRRRRSPSVPGHGRSGSRSRGPPAAAKVAAPEILGAAANAADATPGPDRGDCPLNWRVGRARRCGRFRSRLSIELGVDLVGRGSLPFDAARRPVSSFDAVAALSISARGLWIGGLDARADAVGFDRGFRSNSASIWWDAARSCGRRS